jgi:hypothetical protein
MTTTSQQPPQPPPRSAAPSWREAALARSEIITDAWEVTKTYAGRLADWVLFGCMVMNIIEILVTLPLALSNIVLGTQVVMLDIGGFSLASMADQARQQGNERAARKASRTGWFLIGVTILTLLLVSIGLLWPLSPAVQDATTKAEKGLILVRVVMTVVYGHVIHSLRRAAHMPPVLVPSADVSARLDAYSEQLRLVQAEMQRQAREVQGSVSTLVHSVVQAQTHTLLSELQAGEARVEALVRQQLTDFEAHHEAREAHKTRQSEAPTAPREAKKPVSPRHTGASTKVLSLRQRDVVPTEKRAAVYALLDTDSRLSSYEIAEQTGYPPSTIQRYMKDWKAKQTEAESRAENNEADDTAM